MFYICSNSAERVNWSLAVGCRPNGIVNADCGSTDYRDPAACETIDGIADGLASGDLLKVSELHLQGDSPTAGASCLAVPPDLGDDGLQRVAHRHERMQVLRKGVLRPDRLADAVGADRSFITPRAIQ